MQLCQTEFFEIELFWHLDSVLVLGWNVWNETVLACYTELFEIEMFFSIKTVYLCYTELFEIELFWHLFVCKQKL